MPPARCKLAPDFRIKTPEGHDGAHDHQPINHPDKPLTEKTGGITGKNNPMLNENIGNCLLRQDYCGRRGMQLLND
jgi:hypothetical protein